jgi:DNA-3-methyladenine glycosylase
VTGRILPRTFYNKPAVEVARDLLGKLLVHGETSGIIVETEAYLGVDDLAAHAAAGITPRTRVIFGPPGHAYVYLSYGIHECLNLVAEPEGQAGCVLIRALEPVDGIDVMRRRRAVTSERELTSGPGKLTEALGISRAQNGLDVTRGELVVRAFAMPAFEIELSPRIGISKSVDLELRFSIPGNRFVSQNKKSWPRKSG